MYTMQIIGHIADVKLILEIVKQRSAGKILDVYLGLCTDLFVNERVDKD
jgi:hypothetical protein